MGASEEACRGEALTLRRELGNHFTAGDMEARELSEFDVVLMRQDPPFDMAYITATHFLETIHPRTLVVNNPAEVRNAPEKLFVTGFEGVQPPTLVTSDIEAIYDFRARHGDMVLKPLYGGGGSGVVRLTADDPNLDALLELHAMIGREPVVVQKFIPAVVKGDKRILIVDGEPVGAINRVPAEGQVRSKPASGRPGRGGGPHGAGPRALRHHRPGAETTRPAVRRHRRDRRLSHGDQRHLADRRPAAQALHRHRRHGGDVGPHRGHPSRRRLTPNCANGRTGQRNRLIRLSFRVFPY